MSRSLVVLWIEGGSWSIRILICDILVVLWLQNMNFFWFFLLWLFAALRLLFGTFLDSFIHASLSLEEASGGWGPGIETPDIVVIDRALVAIALRHLNHFKPDWIDYFIKFSQLVRSDNVHREHRANCPNLHI